MNQRYLSISIHDAAIKVAQVKVSGVVEKIARASAGTSSSAEDLAKTLKSLLNGFDRAAPVVCVVPASAATSKTIEIPSTDPQEIQSIINLQASRHTPYSREEVLISYLNVGGSASSTKILLVIAHRNVIKDRLDVLGRCGLSPRKVLFVPEGIGFLYSKGLHLKKDQAALGIIDFTVNSVNFLVIDKGSVVFCRSIPMGIKHLIEQNDGAAKIAEELQKSLAAYQSEADSAVSAFVVTTDHEAVKNVCSLLQQELKAEVRLSPYVNLVKANAVRTKLQRDFADDSFLDVIAPVVALPRSEINLMPEELVMKQTVEEQSKEATTAGIAAVAIMVLLGALIMSKIYFKDTFLNKNLREQFAGQRQEVEKLQERMAQNKVIRDYLQGRMVTLDTIQELYRVTPNEIYLTAVSLDVDGTLTVAGVSESMSQVFSYVKALDDSPMFKNAKTKSTATKKENGKDMAVFEVGLKLGDGQKG